MTKRSKCALAQRSTSQALLYVPAVDHKTDQVLCIAVVGGEAGTLEQGMCAPSEKAGTPTAMQVGIDHDGDPVVKHIDSLGGVSGHSRAVNCVRFSPSGKSCAGSRGVHPSRWLHALPGQPAQRPAGEFLASAGDGGEVMLWRQAELGHGSSTAGWRLAGVLRCLRLVCAPRLLRTGRSLCLHAPSWWLRDASGASLSTAALPLSRRWAQPCCPEQGTAP